MIGSRPSRRSSNSYRPVLLAAIGAATAVAGLLVERWTVALLIVGFVLMAAAVSLGVPPPPDTPSDDEEPWNRLLT